MRSTEGTKVLAGEVIVPLKIEFVEGSESPFEDLIRKVVREELAAAKNEEQRQFLVDQKKIFGESTVTPSKAITISVTGVLPRL